MDPSGGLDDLEKRKTLTPFGIRPLGCTGRNVVTILNTITRLPQSQGRRSLSQDYFGFGLIVIITAPYSSLVIRSDTINKSDVKGLHLIPSYFL